MAGKGNLLNVLLLDDEPFIIKGLVALIDWEAEGYRIAGEALNGRKALSLLKEREFDLILSDIKMPEMDGIELISYVKENKISNAKFIFLSGYYDFQYTKKAIQYGCCDYILKPVQKEELLLTLRKVMEDYRKEAGRERETKKYEKAFLDRNLMALILGHYDDENLQQVQMKMRLTEEVAYIHLEISLRDEDFQALSEEKRREQQRKLYHYAGLLLKERAGNVIYNVMKVTECYDIGLIYCDYLAQEKNMTKEKWISWLVGELSERIGYTVAACTGSAVYGIGAIADSYREAAMTRFFRFYEKQDYKSVLLTKFKDKDSINLQEEYLRKELDELIHSIEINDKGRIGIHVKTIYNRMMDKHTDPEFVGLNIQYFLYQLLGLAYELDGNLNQKEIMRYIRDSIFSSEKIQGNELKFRQFAEEFADYLIQLRQNTANGTMNRIEAEIENHYSENLSLKYLGEKYYINSAYLGQIFKKRYGCNFKDYLNTVRIRKAAEMILRTDKKVSEIAADVGYKKQDYFVTKFEELYGATPTRFRKRNLNR